MAQFRLCTFNSADMKTKEINQILQDISQRDKKACTMFLYMLYKLNTCI